MGSQDCKKGEKSLSGLDVEWENCEFRTENARMANKSLQNMMMLRGAINIVLTFSLFNPQLLLYMTIQRTKMTSCRLWRVQSFM